MTDSEGNPMWDAKKLEQKVFLPPNQFLFSGSPSLECWQNHKLGRMEVGSWPHVARGCCAVFCCVAVRLEFVYSLADILPYY